MYIHFTTCTSFHLTTHRWHINSLRLYMCCWFLQVPISCFCSCSCLILVHWKMKLHLRIDYLLYKHDNCKGTKTEVYYVVEKHEPSTDSPFIPILLPRSKICLNESSHATPFEEICCRLWTSLVYLFVSFWRLEWGLDSYFHGTQNTAGQVSYKVSLYANVPWPHFSLT